MSVMYIAKVTHLSDQKEMESVGEKTHVRCYQQVHFLQNHTKWQHVELVRMYIHVYICCAHAHVKI